MTDSRPLVPTSSRLVPDDPQSASSLVPLPKGGRGRGTETRQQNTTHLVPGTSKTPSSPLGAYRLLLDALTELAGAGRRTPCQALDPEAWHSEDHRLRAEAAEACGGCPVLAACGDYADAADERWVWGGRDRLPRWGRRAVAG